MANKGLFTPESARLAGKKSRGGGRPPNRVRQLVGEGAELAVVKLREIAENSAQLYEVRDQLTALKILAGLLPKTSATTEPNNEPPI